MTKTAFLFAGQGAQKLGMARDFYDNFTVVRKTFDQASQVLGYDLRWLIDEDEAKLNQTAYTQPAILTVSTAIYRVLGLYGIKADMVAGLSLGEYSALVASGALSFEETLRLVVKRAQFMEAAVPAGSGKMVAVMNTDAQIIEEACYRASKFGVVSPANYNTPSQIVIGGHIKAVNAAVEFLKEKGAKRLIPLNVSGPFHTALLQPAGQQLARELEHLSFNDFTLPLVGNTEASIMENDRIPELLARQVMEPVRFYDSIATLTTNGITQAVEIGPGKVLTGFLKKIDKQLPCRSIEDMVSLCSFLDRKGTHGN
ncbi:ACP S-malonyltransferase [Streptococcus castoreus]|uniref:ACP S-malonyltransferase n=1 Tax=Streptococcus castoreus TaxID=254786 RepID=UPI00040A82A3|nr:ACP S-malonyltransferase [Streptococcus castoreus]